MRRIDVSILKPISKVSFEELICKSYNALADISKEQYILEQEITTLTNYIWLSDHFDDLRLDPSFQDVIGLDLEKQGITSSVEVEGGVSNTMGKLMERIRKFFAMVTDWFHKVFDKMASNVVEVLKTYMEKCKDTNNVDKLKKNYTTKGVNTATVAQLIATILKTTEHYKTDLDTLSKTKDKEESTNAESVEEDAKNTKDPELTKWTEQYQKEQEEETGVDPVEGGWFDPTKLNVLSNNITSAKNMVNTLRDLNSKFNSIANEVKASTTTSKELANTKLQAIKSTTTSISSHIKTLNSLMTATGKKVKILLNVLEK